MNPGALRIKLDPNRFPELETERLRLRQLTLDDAEAFLNVFSDPEVTRYYDLDTLSSVDQAAAVIERQNARYAQGDGIRWGIVQRNNDLLIGSVGYVFSHANLQGGLGYELARPYWRMGIMSEALGVVVNFGFRGLGLNRVQALVMPGNVASAALLDKLGFQDEGTLRQYAFFKGRFQDLRCFSMVSEEWRGLSP